VQLGPKPPRFLVSPPFDVFGRLPRERHDTQLNQERENAEERNKLASCKAPLYKRRKFRNEQINRLQNNVIMQVLLRCPPATGIYNSWRIARRIFIMKQNNSAPT
jgi:hypothetical protein